ncbi:SapC family protein [Pseudothauera rhizosphaerae]|uniref:Peptidase n=1 Tax=Pseudothauera rhizosphaerae TaxID=2565932 RepID=A0A4S4AHC2_9RHOO|nr:SapC family protein [Pseudothauera rhizosphaerae]THF58677.1 peptidase [Pseudothauera rhizosphaerae]
MNELETAVAETANDTPATPEAAGRQSGAWPLFYRHPELLNAAAHGTWRIKPAGAGFAAQANSVPVMIGEFAAAAHSYPLVFAGLDRTPVAVLGLEQRNRFVKDDAWQPGAYVPAYVRRYPFVFAQLTEMGESDGFALAIDSEAPMLVKEGDEGQALFEDGKPTEITRQALHFCDAFTRESAATQAFVKLLVEQDLLVDRVANITLPQGRQSTLTGFSVVAPEAFAKLPESVVIEWHRKGWLALVHAHLTSLARFADLLAD